jgi:hypothetical protein
MKVSEAVKRKAKELYAEGKIIKDLETEKRIHFKVMGTKDMHSVIFKKDEKEWECDCKYSTLKGKECSHILACKFMVGSGQDI